MKLAEPACLSESPFPGVQMRKGTESGSDEAKNGIRRTRYATYICIYSIRIHIHIFPFYSSNFGFGGHVKILRWPKINTKFQVNFPQNRWNGTFVGG